MPSFTQNRNLRACVLSPPLIRHQIFSKNMSTSSQDMLLYRNAPVASLWHLTGLVLRDFFHAENSESMRLSLGEISDFLDKEQQDNLINTDWLMVEYEFNRLFVGPMKLQAAPYSSVYNDPDPVLMGKGTQQVKEILNALGLNIENENQIPEDHISYEIELCLLLVDNSQQSDNQKLLHRFVTDHVNLWLPLFLEKIISNAKTQPIQLAATLLSDWFSELKTRV